MAARRVGSRAAHDVGLHRHVPVGAGRPARPQASDDALGHSELLQAQAQDGEVFDELNLWITDHLGSEELSVERLAAQAHLSPRHFARLYKQRTGRTPAKAVEGFRLEAARRLLEDSSRNVDQIARLCGFGDEERMRLTFQRNLGMAPRDYRKRFAKSATLI